MVQVDEKNDFKFTYSAVALFVLQCMQQACSGGSVFEFPVLSFLWSLPFNPGCLCPVLAADTEAHPFDTGLCKQGSGTHLEFVLGAAFVPRGIDMEKNS